MRGFDPSGDFGHSRAFWTASRPAPRSAPEVLPDPPPWWRAAAALAAALLVQASFGPLLTFRGAVMPLVVLVVGWYGLRAGSLRGLAFGLIAGACEDAFAGTTGAAWTFATAAAGLAAGKFARSWAADMPPALCVGAAFLTLARYAAFAVIMRLEGHAIPLPAAHARAALWQAAAAGLLVGLALRLAPALGRAASKTRGRFAHTR